MIAVEDVDVDVDVEGVDVDVDAGLLIDRFELSLSVSVRSESTPLTGPRFPTPSEQEHAKAHIVTLPCPVACIKSEVII